MHELSMCRFIADTATAHANGRTVERISLQIGHFRQVVPDTLQRCWALQCSGGPMADCVLEVDAVPATVECLDCSETTTLDEPALRCGTCGGASVVLATGDEFLIVSIDVTTTSPKGR